MPYGPVGAVVDSSGYIYVSDRTNRVQKFTSDGVFVTKWGSYGSDDGQFQYPVDVAVDGSGYIYVSDNGNNRVQKFSLGYSAGISAWSVPGWTELPITMDGADTGFTTPHTFEGLEGTHTFTLPETANNCTFTKWTKEGATAATNNTIIVDSEGTYTAQYTIEHLYFEVPFEEEVYVVETYSNSSVSDLTFNEDLLRIQFSVEGADGQGGFCNVTIPVELLSSGFSVFVDDVELMENNDFTVVSNSTHSRLSINYEQESGVISVVEVFGIPDFAGWLFLPLLMLTTFFALVNKKLKKQRFIKKPK